MKSVFLIFSALLIFSMSQITDAQTPQEFAEIWDATHISKKFPSNVRHTDVKNYLDELKKLGIKVEEVGKSVQKREIYQIEWGKGKTKVFMWSQMHGDEPTATSALMDMFAFLQTNRDKKQWVKKLEETLTIRAIPMLNPDGAEVFKRRNAQNVDINRDTINLETPEANLLLKLRNEWIPDIGFNLHNQQELTTVGYTTNQASISLLAVAANPKTPLSETQLRNRRICSEMVSALNQFIKGNIGKYDDTYTPNAFGDTFSDLGTATILIETGGLSEKDEMFLVKMNFIALLTAMQSLATESEKSANMLIYETLPENTSGRLHNFIFRNATIFKTVQRTAYELEEEGFEDIKDAPEPDPIFEQQTTDVAINRERRRAENNYPPIYVSIMGNLDEHRGLKEFDVEGFYMVTPKVTLTSGERNTFLFYKKTRKINWKSKNLETDFPPDAIFAYGNWVKPLPK